MSEIAFPVVINGSAWRFPFSSFLSLYWIPLLRVLLQFLSSIILKCGCRSTLVYQSRYIWIQPEMQSLSGPRKAGVPYRRDLETKCIAERAQYTPDRAFLHRFLFHRSAEYN